MVKSCWDKQKPLKSAVLALLVPVTHRTMVLSFTPNSLPSRYLLDAPELPLLQLEVLCTPQVTR